MNKIIKVRSTLRLGLGVQRTDHNQKGFTLLEALVAIVLFGVIGVITVDLLGRVFQGSNKAQTISKIKQNGQSAMNIIDDDIRNANSISCLGDFPNVSPDTGGTIVISKSGQYIRYQIYPQPQTSGNGYIVKDILSPAIIGDLSPCDQSIPNTNPVYLTNQDTNTGVSVKDGKFSLSAKEGFKDKVRVEFNLEAGVSASKNFEFQVEPVNFSTTIVLR